MIWPGVRRPAAAMAVVAAASLFAACSSDQSQASHSVHPTALATIPSPDGLAEVPSGWSLIATTRGAIPSYDEPGGGADGTVPATWHGGPSALPVIDQRPGWLRVRLATRPNESTAWVRRTDVTLTSTPYRIVVDLTTRHLQLLRLGHVVLDAPAGVGTPSDPTPTGQYFAALYEAPPSPGYGPFVLVTSAHSTAITDWEQSGDALVAIHGPLGTDAEIGTTGAAVSHGCIRLHVADQLQLRAVPVGTPITITS